MDTITFPILIVEDDSDERWLMDEAFKKLGAAHEVKKFVDGPGLIRYLENVERDALPRLIVLDNSLPQISLQEILAVIRSNEHWKGIRIVVLMNTVSNEMPDYLRRYGADYFLHKPFNAAELADLARDLQALADLQRI